MDRADRLGEPVALWCRFPFERPGRFPEASAAGLTKFTRNSRADKVRSPSIQPVLLLYLDIQAMEASMKLLRIELALLIGILVAASILISSMAQAGVAPP